MLTDQLSNIDKAVSKQADKAGMVGLRDKGGEDKLEFARNSALDQQFEAE